MTDKHALLAALRSYAEIAHKPGYYLDHSRWHKQQDVDSTVWYHGTKAAPFSAFKPRDPADPAFHIFSRLGIHFAADPAQASTYAMAYDWKPSDLGDAPSVVPVRLKISNPATYSNDDELGGALMQSALEHRQIKQADFDKHTRHPDSWRQFLPRHRKAGVIAGAFVKKLQGSGQDGIVHGHEGFFGLSDSYPPAAIAFHPDQIEGAYKAFALAEGGHMPDKHAILIALKSYAEYHKPPHPGEVLRPSEKDPSVKRWQAPQKSVTDIPVSDRKWGAGETDNGKRFKDFFSSITNTQGFGQHIDSSIPGFAEHRGAMAMAVADRYPTGSILDVGASEGQWGNTIHKIAPGARVVNLDPNPDMLKNNVDALGEKALGAWVEGFHDGEQEIPTYVTPPGEAHDVVGMHMVRQFVTRDGDEWYGEVKKHIKPNGIFLYSCKVTPSPGKEEDWAQREREKDDFKRQTYTQEEMDRKSDEVLVGMHHLMMPHEEEMQSLGKHFKHVIPIWHDANFRGYVASDSHEAAHGLAAHYHEAKKGIE